jgi:hypothetical protein
VVATTTTNTTPFTYTFVSPSLALIRAGNEAVTVEVKNGQQWEPVSLYRNYFWRYALQYVTLAPGGSYTAQLRVTFGEDVQTATPSWVYQGMSTLFGGYLALDVQPYTQVPRG